MMCMMQETEEEYFHPSRTVVAKSGRYCSYSCCDKLYLVVGVLTALNTVSTTSLISTKQSFTSYTSSRVYPARALGLLLADGAVGWRMTFWRIGRFFL